MAPAVEDCAEADRVGAASVKTARRAAASAALAKQRGEFEGKDIELDLLKRNLACVELRGGTECLAEEVTLLRRMQVSYAR
jgi:hypothetical protein